MSNQATSSKITPESAAAAASPVENWCCIASKCPLDDYVQGYLNCLTESLAICRFPVCYPSDINRWNAEDQEELCDLLEQTYDYMKSLLCLSSELNHVLHRPHSYSTREAEQETRIMCGCNWWDESVEDDELPEMNENDRKNRLKDDPRERRSQRPRRTEQENKVDGKRRSTRDPRTTTREDVRKPGVAPSNRRVPKESHEERRPGPSRRFVSQQRRPAHEETRKSHAQFDLIDGKLVLTDVQDEMELHDVFPNMKVGDIWEIPS